SYPEALTKGIEAVIPPIRSMAEKKGLDVCWVALKALESDYLTLQMLDDKQQQSVHDARIEMEEALGDEIDIVTADARYTLIGNLVESIVTRTNLVSQSVSEKIDNVVLNRVLGIPIFLFVMYLMFLFTIVIGGLFNDFFEQIFAVFFVDGLGALLTFLGAPQWAKVIFADGMGGGIATVASFIPIIGCLFIFLSILEDSGYMSRAAFVMDRFMRFIGLPGKSFVPLIVGFGCNVPAVMATRTLENHRDRLMTIAMAPFMSCGARLPIFALFAIAFFPVGGGGQNIVFLLYLMGIAAAILTGLALKYTLLPGKGAPFVMELPPYHIPTLRGVFRHMWENLKGFIFRAGKVIVPMVMVINVINSIGVDGSFGHNDTEESVLSSIGKTIAPAFKPMGLTEENWPASVGIFTGLLAKEAVVGTLNALYEQEAQAQQGASAESDEEGAFDLWAGIVAAYQNIPDKIAELKDNVLDPLGMNAAAEDEAVQANPKEIMVSMFKTKTAAFSYLILGLLYFPCFAVIGVVAREAGRRWALFVAVWTSVFAYCASVLFYQIATFAEHPSYSASWIIGIVVFAAVGLYLLRRVGGANSTAIATAASYS
ncbi:MAG: ferrous iron transport protein B, partial [Saezia sp.]